MRRHRSLFRLGAALAIGGLALGPCAAPLARAQDATPLAAPAPDTAAPVDPPSRVGRVASLTGTVSFRSGDQAEWQPATLNYPVTMGDALWTQPGAGADLGLGGVKLALDHQTEADIDTLTDATLAVTEPQGAIYVHVRVLPPNTTATVTTPRGAVNLTAPGRYEVVAGDATQPTRVEVIDGAANILVGNVALQVAPRQTATVTGSDSASFQGSVGAAADDPFITAQLARERPRPVAAQAYTPPPLVEDMTGAESLQGVGEWRQTPEYGEVWYPPAPADYVPYRDGHWAFVAPWGWTWVDDAPWGFAPFHYGRWARVHDRWGWVPVERGAPIEADARPVYAPALVSFIGFGAGVAVGAALAGGHGGPGDSVGWVPLAPGEPYHPAFRASDAYVRQVNIHHVSDVSAINNAAPGHYANERAATVVPTATMTGSRPVARSAMRVTPQQLAAARPIEAARPPVAPTRATIGVTQAVARQLRLEPAAGGPPPARVAAPGPAVVAAPAARGAAGHPALPALARPPGAPATHAAPAPRPNEPPAAAAQPAAPARPEALAARPAPAPAGARPAERPAAAAPPEGRPAPASARPPEHQAPAARPEAHPAPAAARPPQAARPEPPRPAPPQAARPEPPRPAPRPPEKPAEKKCPAGQKTC